ncbi:hypothetical protein F5144DRAFT_660065 [Chaetomium tenue]|uniref:Uncharacterized protein n=1 Tax=Chaetomium tenue TaxID=1854479 RepID=A0ACB7NUU9_9PEZI|nr:hypothetical protein F5144DRAFT_660065 [Chaetomium globosum]
MHAMDTNGNSDGFTEGTLLLFGPQMTRLTGSHLTDLRTTILGNTELDFLTKAVRALPSQWEATVQTACPGLGAGDLGATQTQQLQQLANFFDTGELPASEPPNNVVLAPLTVVSQLAEYLRLGRRGPVQGFCVGFLAATAVASSRNREELVQLAGVAIRLAACVGAVIDLEEHKQLRQPGSLGLNAAHSVRWTSSEEKEHLEKTLASFPEVYVSCVTDIDRVTITIPEGLLAEVSQRLADGGMVAQPVGLYGRYHEASQNREVLVRELKSLCQQNVAFQFPTAENMVLPLRSTAAADGPIINQGALSNIAIDSILGEKCEWFETVRAAVAAFGDRSPIDMTPIGGPGAVPRSLAPGKAGEKSALPRQPVLVNGTSRSSEPIPRPVSEGPVRGDAIAVIGMACRYPQAPSLDEFWSLITSGRNAVGPVPHSRFRAEELWREPKGPFWGNFVQDPDAFDHRFFQVSAREAASMDPQQRLILQVAYEAIESTGYAPGHGPQRVGCYMGVGSVDYEANVASDNATAFSATGTLRAFISGKVSHHFGWTGPSVTIDTACSSSAVAIHHACKALQTKECPVAIAGGVNLITSPSLYQNLAAASFLSPTGASRAFDAQGDGYCRGEGAGVLVLKPLAQALADGDTILGTILGTAVNQGSNCTPITVPDSAAQSELYAQALAGGGVAPTEVTYVEAHGTGTPVGDPIECASIRSAFGGAHRQQELTIGSVKDVIGHTEAASGVAGCIKTLLMMQHGVIPKQPNFTRRQACHRNAAAPLGDRQPSKAHGARQQLRRRRDVRAYAAALKAYLDRQTTTPPGTTTKTQPSLQDITFHLGRRLNPSFPHIATWTTSSLPALRQDLAALASGTRPITTPPSKPTPLPIILTFGGQTGLTVHLSPYLVSHSPTLLTHLTHCNSALHTLHLPPLFPRIFDPTPYEPDDLVALHAALFSVHWATVGEAIVDAADLVTAHTRDTVHFSAAIERIVRRHPAGCVWLEAGSASPVVAMARRALPSTTTAASHVFLPLDLGSGSSSPSSGLARAVTSLWAAGTAATFWPFHGRQYPWSKHWIDFQAPGRRDTVETPAPEVGPAELALFAVDASHDDFILLCPASMYFELVIRAMKAVQGPPAKGVTQVPRLENLRILSPLALKPDGRLYLSTWNFSLFSSPLTGPTLPSPSSPRTTHALGTAAFIEADSTAVASRFRYEQIARVFGRIVNYAPHYQGVRNVVAGNGEVVGDVSPLGVSNPLAIDNFLQVAGIHVNCVTGDGREDDVFVCTGIGEVLWSDTFMHGPSGGDGGKPSNAPSWKVYSNVDAKRKNTVVNDILVLDPASGDVVLAILNAEFTRLNGASGSLPTPPPEREPVDEATPPQGSVNGHTPGPRLIDALRNLLSEVLGAELAEIQPASELADLGIKKHFSLTDVQSLSLRLEPLVSGYESTSAPTPAGSDAPPPVINGVVRNEEPSSGSETSEWLASNRQTYDTVDVYPHQAQLVVAYVPGNGLPNVKHRPRHEKDAGLLEINGDGTRRRTDRPAPQATASDLHERILQRFPQHFSEHSLLHTTGSRLAECLSGDADPISLLFGNAEARRLLGDVYTHAPMFKAGTLFLTRFLAQTLTQHLADHSGRGEIRILELGAGTGGTTSHLLEHLAASGLGHKLRYTFTDLSASLYPFMEYAVLDIEQSPPAHLLGRFDMVISTNCIHATRDLTRSCTHIRRTLREGGLLCLVELTQNLFWFDLVFGLLEGWWLFNDGRSHALASETLWQKDLLASGFDWVDWSDGASAEASILRLIVASTSPRPYPSPSPPPQIPQGPGVADSDTTTAVSTPLETLETVTFKHAGPLALQADIHYPPTPDPPNSKPRPTTLLEGPMTDVRDALAWARHTLPDAESSPRRHRSDVSVDGTRVVAVGWSTGGMLALSLGWTGPAVGVQAPEAVLGFYCPSDYEDGWWGRVNLPFGEDVEGGFDVWEGVEEAPIVEYNPPAAAQAAGGWMARRDARSRIALHMNWRAQTVPVLVHGLRKGEKGEKGTPMLPWPEPEQVVAISPLAQVRLGNYKTPTFLVHPVDDDLIPWQQAQRTVDELRARGVSAEVRIVDKAVHLFDLYRRYDRHAGAVAAISDGYEFLARSVR